MRARGASIRRRLTIGARARACDSLAAGAGSRRAHSHVRFVVARARASLAARSLAEATKRKPFRVYIARAARAILCARLSRARAHTQWPLARSSDASDTRAPRLQINSQAAPKQCAARRRRRQRRFIEHLRRPLITGERSGERTIAGAEVNCARDSIAAAAAPPTRKSAPRAPPVSITRPAPLIWCARQAPAPPKPPPQRPAPALSRRGAGDSNLAGDWPNGPHLIMTQIGTRKRAREIFAASLVCLSRADAGPPRGTRPLGERPTLIGGGVAAPTRRADSRERRSLAGAAAHVPAAS